MSSVGSRKPKAAAPISRNQTVTIKQESAVPGGLDTNKDSLAYLIEDRVDMVKQIFAVLDAKTIKSMAPDHLSGHTAESLQEYCLDELLGISNKRLLSIIDETKCPTDTEDSDSDVEKIEEHISLEEISSDSPDEASRVRTVRRSKHTRGKHSAVLSGRLVIELLKIYSLKRWRHLNGPQTLRRSQKTDDYVGAARAAIPSGRHPVAARPGAVDENRTRLGNRGQCAETSVVDRHSDTSNRGHCTGESDSGDNKWRTGSGGIQTNINGTVEIG